MNLLLRKKDQDIIDYYKNNYGKGFPKIDREVDRLYGVKKCGMCGKRMPNTKDFFHKNSQTKDNLHYNCRTCRNAAKRLYYQKNLKK